MSFWFVPSVIVLGAAGLAADLMALDANVELDVDKKWPLLFGVAAAGSRGPFTAVASSIITAAGVVFSITIVAFTLASGKYTPSTTWFMCDRMNQVVLGVFVDIVAYCLSVFQTIRGDVEGTFVNWLAALGRFALAFIGIAVLIEFIHKISTTFWDVISEYAQRTAIISRQIEPPIRHPAFKELIDACGGNSPRWSPPKRKDCRLLSGGTARLPGNPHSAARWLLRSERGRRLQDLQTLSTVPLSENHD